VAGHRESSLEQRDTIEYRHLGMLLILLRVIVEHVFEPCAIQPLQPYNTKNSRLCAVCVPTFPCSYSRLIFFRNHTSTHLGSCRI